MPKETITEPVVDEDGNKYCLICGKKLRPLLKSEDWDTRVYHITCFRNLIQDIYRYDNVAYKKYGHKKRLFDGTLQEDIIKGKKNIIVNFD